MTRGFTAAIASVALLLGGCSPETTEGSGGDESNRPGAGKRVTNKNWEKVFDKEGSAGKEPTSVLSARRTIATASFSSFGAITRTLSFPPR